MHEYIRQKEKHKNENHIAMKDIIILLYKIIKLYNNNILCESKHFIPH